MLSVPYYDLSPSVLLTSQLLGTVFSVTASSASAVGLRDLFNMSCTSIQTTVIHNPKCSQTTLSEPLGYVEEEFLSE